MEDLNVSIKFDEHEITTITIITIITTIGHNSPQLAFCSGESSSGHE